MGTSGWQYDHWRGRFYPKTLPERLWLEHYSTRFATVEVNNTFYRLPAPATFTDWARRVPPDFEMAIKASRFLTHFRRLRDPEEPVERLLKHAAPLQSHLAVVLLQLPPDMTVEPARLDATLRAFANRARVAVEVRHPSWWCDEVRDVLRMHQAALCLVDRDSRLVTPEWRTASWCYVRLHFGRSRPESCYGTRALSSWVARIRAMFGDDADAYVYFNNDGNGCAVRDAIAFARLARAAGLQPTRVPQPDEAPVG